MLGNGMAVVALPVPKRAVLQFPVMGRQKPFARKRKLVEAKLGLSALARAFYSCC